MVVCCYFAAKQRIVSATYILDQPAIDLKIRRMALEIAERNIDSDRIVLAGIETNGVVIAEKLLPLLRESFPGELEIITVWLDKKHPQQVTIGGEAKLDEAVVVIVDDVANSGKTLTYALKPFLDYFPAKIQTLVLVDRTHKAFPIQPDYVGFSLSTTLQDYIDVTVAERVLTGAYVE
jgi:pyrimidine operon attenuation protein/uracil phosphoribosyltransferase